MIKKVPWARAAFCVLMALYALYMLHPAFALAEQGNVIVTQTFNADADYDAYQVFAATVDEQGQAANISWARDDIKQLVLAYIDGHGYEAWLGEAHPGDDMHDHAQNAAEYIGTMIESAQNVEVTESEEPSSPAETFAMGLARTLASSEIEPTAVIHASEAYAADQGYWLLVSSMATISSPDEAGTAPIWLVVGASPVDAEEKTSLPSLTFAVQEDSTGAWQKTADSNRKQNLRYRVEGTLPDNFDTFEQYHYRFEIHLPQAITLNLAADEDLKDSLNITAESKAVDIDGTHVSAQYDGSSLVVDFTNLRSEAWATYGLTNKSTITVEYDAHLKDDAAVGMPGHMSEAVLVYTADPVSLAESTTQALTVTVFTYQLELLKADEQTDALLADAAFSLRADTDGVDETPALYVQGDGSLGDTVYTFTTDEHGKVTIAGLDEGSYILTEEAAPTGYQKLSSSIKITIAAHLSELDRTIEDLTVSNEGEAPCEVAAVQAEKGSAALKVSNSRLAEDEPTDQSVERLPQTGVGPVAECFIALGLAAVCLSCIRMRHRRF